MTWQKKTHKKAAQKKTRDHDYLTLPHGCYCTPPYISPANWDSSDASIIIDWRVRYNFYDPTKLPTGKSFPGVVQGMNKYKTLPARQEAARKILADTIADLNDGFNPIIGVPVPVPFSSEIEEIGPNGRY
ncbi:hypothetical protein ACX0G9_30035 [Flavitalea flava]